MREQGIWAKPGQLIAIDLAADPPQIVYRWQNIQAESVADGYRLIKDGSLLDPGQLRTRAFPNIQSMYARMEALKDLDPKQIVETGYDRIAERYLEWTRQDSPGKREEYASLLLKELPPGARVLELGCGAGVPATKILAQRFQVTAVDISARQISLARQNVPQAHFVQADMAELDLPPDSYHGVIALYAIWHLPRDEQPRLLSDIASWMRPGGLLVATMGTRPSASGIEEDWLGAPMYWSSYDSETNVRLVRDAGLEIICTEIETVVEFDETVHFMWIVARKPLPKPA
jgi:SAM-dependent methyltransferase